MAFNSPLRYPGGKNKLSKFISAICIKNNITTHYIEPYAGGAAIALHLLFNGYVKNITINDMDRSVYAFWYTVLNNTQKLCNRIEQTKITVKNWYDIKEIQRDKQNASLFDLGFSTFFLNRTNYSGILGGGMLGGVDQNGKNKIDCRFNKKELITRIKKIQKYKKHIHLSNYDALYLVKNIQKKINHKNILYYFDPPYYVKGASLYMNYYKTKDHEELAKTIKKIKNAKWIMTYDNTPKIIDLYRDYRKKKYTLYHTANQIHRGKEILFFSNNLKQISLNFMHN